MITKYGYLKLKEQYKSGYRWIARDKDKRLYVYTTEPKKIEYEWRTNKFNSSGVYSDDSYHLFPCVKWEDEEPTKIDDLIRDYESHQVITGGNNVNKAELAKEIEDVFDNIGIHDYRIGERCENYSNWRIDSKTIRKILSAIEKHGVEEEKQYILKFSNGQYLYSCDLGTTDEALACKLTQAEIESVDPRLMQFAEEVSP